MRGMYRVVGIVSGGQGFRDEVIPKTEWFPTYEDAKEAKIKMENHDNRMRTEKGWGYFIGYYHIEARELKWVSEYID